MLYIFMGQSCTGKSTVADKMKELLEVEISSGKDYLRMAKNENDAWKLFYDKLTQAAQTEASKGSIIYVITEREHLNKVNSIHGIRKVKFTASFDVLKSRFSQRMRGNLPEPVEKKLMSQYEEWQGIEGDMLVDTTEDISVEDVINTIVQL